MAGKAKAGMAHSDCGLHVWVSAISSVRAFTFTLLGRVIFLTHGYRPDNIRLGRDHCCSSPPSLTFIPRSLLQDQAEASGRLVVKQSQRDRQTTRPINRR